MARKLISIRVEVSGLRALDNIARHEGKKRSALVREILAEGINKRLKAAGGPR
jgi:predicted DNA-binding protein